MGTKRSQSLVLIKKSPREPKTPKPSKASLAHIFIANIVQPIFNAYSHETIFRKQYKITNFIQSLFCK